MKILFAIKSEDFWAPVGMMQIAAMVKKSGHETYVANLSNEDLLEKAEKIRPDIVAYSSCTGEHNFFSEANRKLKAKHKNIFTIMGGPHPTFFPEVLEEAELDAICIGEGEYAFVELLDNLQKKKSISKIKNILVKGGKFNGLRPLVQDLDSLPFPDRDLFLGSLKEKIPTMSFLTSRGCPYSCTYCFNHSFRKMHLGEKYYRKRTVNNLLKEIKDMKAKYRIGFVKFYDDLFTTGENDPWFIEFCEKYPKEIGLPFLVYMRFDLMTEKVAKKLSAAGCKSAFMSIESASPRIRESVLNRRMSNESILKGAEYCRKYKINILSYIMLGLPSSSITDDINAVDFSIKAKIPVPEFVVFQPLPKTEITDYCLKKGFLKESYLKEKNYGGFSHPSMLNCFTPEEKNMQININLLGPIAVEFPILRNLIINHLIRLKCNWFFKFVYKINKLIVYPTKIYKMKYSLRETIDIVKKAVKLEKKRRE